MKTVQFDNLQISSKLKRAIKDMGFEEATPIQTKSIPQILEGKDIVGQAQTGTGKTASFGIPILEMIDANNKNIQALVLCPTRELAIQVAEEIKRLAKYMKKIKILPIYGGQPINRQIHALKRGVQIVIGTPGRVMDHMRRKTLKMTNLRLAVLDEADEMLNMGFREDIETILKATPKDRQTILFSATMPKAILQIAKTYQNKPEFIKVVHKNLTVPSIEQYYFEMKQRNKFEVLTRLIDIHNPKLSLVFCNTKKQVDELVLRLQGRGYFADGLHGDMKQRQRDRVMNSFRMGNTEILVATDVAARGIDVDDIEIVFNYDVPQDEEYYVHRIGRTGRAGRTGKAFTFVVGKEIYKLKNIQKYTKTKIKRERIPSIREVEESKASIILDKIIHIIENENLSNEISNIEKLLDDDYTAIDIAAALLKMTMGKGQEKSEDNKLQLDDNKVESDMVRLFINVGKKKKIRPGDVVGAISDNAEIPGNLIGSIDIHDKYTFVEVPKEYGKQVLNSMKNNTIKGQKVNIELANRK
ncbi:DEAD/DEAH box helicase [Caldisalinibacter kiritimatiensis]|uniref:ATP-dependent RNA helicase CshA n=1 Tax=Caldisalinibacter kiritimatiensis TaxID=1304284 RepID=R1AQ46_9FIRM|nr:DEAD/DEAH box helicase [Caldisalinibacter kiritimatiensis]EOC99252.1 Cold-shock DEAD-box protein A [Caldisalinibacter kiritimatiensis]